MSEFVHHYDIYGNPISFERWAELFNEFKNRQLAYTRIWTEDIVEKDAPDAPVSVSTIWLGLDHSFGGGPPLIFETMVFGGVLDQTQERHSTMEQALAAHQMWVDLVMESVSMGRIEVVDLDTLAPPT